jgi:hypothetical protein
MALLILMGLLFLNSLGAAFRAVVRGKAEKAPASGSSFERLRREDERTA